MRMTKLFSFFDGSVLGRKQAIEDSNALSLRLQCTLKSEADETIIDIHDVIGDDWVELGSQSLVPMIRDIETPIRLSIDTPGGSVFDAVAIYQALVQHPHKVTADIMGMAASAGTIITASADHVRIAQAGTFMLHRAWAVVAGNSAEMRVTADLLDKVDLELDAVLSKRSGVSVEDIRQLSIGEDGSDGTWLTGTEAVEKGFADELLPTKSKPAQPSDSVKSQHATAIRGMALDLERMRATRT